MGEHTSISWTHHTFNPWWGCAQISPACDNCYAMTTAQRFGKWWGVDAPRRFFEGRHWNEPLRWNRNAEAAGERRRVFCASMGDIFDNHPDVEAARLRMWDLIRSTPHLDWLLLTKRIGNAARLLPSDWGNGFANVWLGATVVNQAEAERDIPKLLVTPAAIRFLSCEPLLGPIDLRILQYDSGTLLPDSMTVNDGRCSIDALRGVSTWPGSHYRSPTIKSRVQFIAGEVYESHGESRAIDWVITGGESGRNARPIDPAWVRSLRDQCVAAAVAFHHKQWGEWLPAGSNAFDELGSHAISVGAPSHDWSGGAQSFRVGKLAAGRILDGRIWDEFPRSSS